jgi:hypothetical protein
MSTYLAVEVVVVIDAGCIHCAGCCCHGRAILGILASAANLGNRANRLCSVLRDAQYRGLDITGSE